QTPQLLDDSDSRPAPGNSDTPCPRFVLGKIFLAKDKPWTRCIAVARGRSGVRVIEKLRRLLLRGLRFTFASYEWAFSEVLTMTLSAKTRNVKAH
ncbi:MAG: hypothetical protein EBX64_12220, partial [Betaproteobacteria bacterium]|nr:hypothetical protein [Betaproteobacteria bacterium]